MLAFVFEFEGGRDGQALRKWDVGSPKLNSDAGGEVHATEELVTDGTAATWDVGHLASDGIQAGGNSGGGERKVWALGQGSGSSATGVGVGVQEAFSGVYMTYNC